MAAGRGPRHGFKCVPEVGTAAPGASSPRPATSPGVPSARGLGEPLGPGPPGRAGPPAWGPNSRARHRVVNEARGRSPGPSSSCPRPRSGAHGRGSPPGSSRRLRLEKECDFLSTPLRVDCGTGGKRLERPVCAVGRRSSPHPSPAAPSPHSPAQALEVVRTQIWDQIKEVYKPGTVTIPHPFQAGDRVLIRRHRPSSLEPRWKGPYLVLLTTPTAVKVDGIAAWVHASHLKPAPPSAPDESWELEKTDHPLKLRFRRRQNGLE
ncbi:collagen alpha-1(I) chain-like [Cynocephalus volans]|uniref:collagen alpha-1(I) chain-like n=1 Tax=Cynocephalus volans TaxID=110931 RepID=UPI002FC6CF90